MLLGAGLGCGIWRRLLTAADATLSAPTVVTTSESGAPPAVTITYGDDIYPGDYLQIQRSTDGAKDADGGYTTATLDILHYFTTEEAGREQLSNSDLTADGYTDPASGAWFQQYRWARETGELDGSDNPVLDYSSWSNEISGSIINITSSATPSVESGVPLWHYLSTDVSTTAAIVAGADQASFELSGSVLRFELDGTKLYTGIDDSYEVQVRFTDASSNVRTQTITTTVVAETAVPAGSAFTLDPSRVTLLKQNIDGTGDMTAPGDPIGYVEDRSGNLFHFAAAANDDTRPTLRIVNGKKCIRADGFDDHLFRNADPGFYSSGCVVGFAVQATGTGNNEPLFAMGRAGSNNPSWNLVSTHNGSPTKLGAQLQNDSGSTVLGSTTNLGDSIFNGTKKTLIVVDDVTELRVYVDGVLTTTQPYTRSGSVTLDRVRLFAYARNTALNFFVGDVFAAAGYAGTTASVADLHTWLASR